MDTESSSSSRRLKRPAMGKTKPRRQIKKANKPEQKINAI